MRVKWFVLRGIGVFAVATLALGIWKQAEITQLLAVNNLFDESRIVQSFSQVDDLFFHLQLSRGEGTVSALPVGPEAVLSAAADQWIKDRSVTGLVILKDGQLVQDRYFLGTGPEDLRISWSVAKSFLASLWGVLGAEGLMPPLDAQVVDYAPLLKGFA